MMWTRSLTGIFLGLLISVSAVINLFLLFPAEADTRLLIALLTGFIIWAVVMVYTYHRPVPWKTCLQCIAVLAVSVAINLALTFL